MPTMQYRKISQESNRLYARKRVFTMSDRGKGHKPRPIPDPKKFEENWDKIFGKKPKKDTK